MSFATNTLVLFRARLLLHFANWMGYSQSLRLTLLIVYSNFTSPYRENSVAIGVQLALLDLIEPTVEVGLHPPFRLIFVRNSESKPAALAGQG